MARHLIGATSAGAVALTAALTVSLAAALTGCGGSSGTDAGSASSAPVASATSSHSAGHTAGHTAGTSTRSGRGHHGQASSSSPSSGSTSGPQSRATSQPTLSAPTGHPSQPTSTQSGGIEIQTSAPTAGPTRLPGLPHTHDTRAPLVSSPLPRAATAHGRYARGYPTGALPKARHSRILLTSVSPSGDRLQVALTSRTSRRVAKVELFYRHKLSGLGFHEGDVSTANGSTTLTFARGDNHVVVTLTRGRVLHYSVFATLVAGN
jgi:hypothetical protein